MINISKNIKTLRTERGLTQETLAERVHVTRQAISSWETGRTQPDVNMLALLSEAMGVDVETLIYGKKNKVGLEADPAQRRRTLTLTLTVMGSLFTAVGLILIFVFFWREIPDFFKLTLAFLPFLAGAAAGLTVLFKKDGNQILRESAAVLWTAGLVASGALVNAVFHARFGFGNLLMAEILLTLPLVFLLRSVFSFSFTLIAASVETGWLLSHAPYDAPAYRLWFWTVIAVCAAGVCLIYRQKREANAIAARLEAWLLMLFALIQPIMFWIRFERGGYRVIMILILLFGLCQFLAGGEEKTSLPLRTPGAVICGIALFVNAVVFIFMDPYGALDYPDFGLPLLLVMILCVGLPLLFGLRGRKKYRLGKIGVCYAVCIALSLPIVFFAFRSLQLLTVLPSLVFGILTVTSGVKNVKLARVNAGIINISALFILVTGAFSENVLLLGVTALLTGAALLASNRYMLKKLAKEREKTTDAATTGKEKENHA